MVKKILTHINCDDVEKTDEVRCNLLKKDEHDNDNSRYIASDGLVYMNRDEYLDYIRGIR